MLLFIYLRPFFPNNKNKLHDYDNGGEKTQLKILNNSRSQFLFAIFCRVGLQLDFPQFAPPFAFRNAHRWPQAATQWAEMWRSWQGAAGAVSQAPSGFALGWHSHGGRPKQPPFGCKEGHVFFPLIKLKSFTVTANSENGLSFLIIHGLPVDDILPVWVATGN